MTFEVLTDAVPTSYFTKYLSGEGNICFFCGYSTKIKPFLWDRQLTDLLVTWCGECNLIGRKLVELSEKELFTLRII